MKPSSALIIRLIVLAGVIALIGVIALNTYWEDVTIPSPLRGEAVTNPFYAVEKFSRELGAQAEWRQTLGALPEPNAVIFLSNWHWDLIKDRRTQLEEWVASGGRIVLDRSLIGGEDHLKTWAGISRDHPDEDDDDEDDDEDTEVEDEDASNDSSADDDAAASDSQDAEDEDPFCDDLRVVASDIKAGPDDVLNVCALDGYSYLSTDRNIIWGLENEYGELQALRVKVGGGSVTSINAIPFGNRDLTEVDHGRLFVAATQLRHGDHIIFVSERDHPSLLGLMWIYGAPVVVLALLTLGALLWRGGVRFGPLAAATDTARRSLAEQIRGTGQFTIRLGGGKALHAAAVRALFDVAARKIARYPSLAHTQRITAIANATGTDEEVLANAVNYSGARRPADLAHSISIVESARRKLVE